MRHNGRSAVLGCSAMSAVPYKTNELRRSGCLLSRADSRYGSGAALHGPATPHASAPAYPSGPAVRKFVLAAAPPPDQVSGANLLPVQAQGTGRRDARHCPTRRLECDCARSRRDPRVNAVFAGLFQHHQRVGGPHALAFRTDENGIDIHLGQPVPECCRHDRDIDENFGQGVLVGGGLAAYAVEELG